MTLDAFQLAARAVNDSASLALFGLALFPFYTGAAAPKAQRAAAAIAVLSLAALAAATTADIAGSFPSAATLHAILLETQFGKVWLLRAALCIGALAVARAGASRRLVLLSAAQLAAIAATGHALARADGLGAATHAAHMLAAGAWAGGALGLALKPAQVVALARRFTPIGYAAATLTPLLGLAALALITGDWRPNLADAYGRWAALKIGLLAALLATAAFNRFYAAPRGAASLLRRGIVFELCVMSALIGAASALSITSPALQ